jgi:hypothetical protein
MNSNVLHQKYLLIGMSHIEAIREALNTKEGELSVVNLNSSPEYYTLSENKVHIDSIVSNLYERVFISIGGNFHNLFGLAEHPVPLGVYGEKVEFPFDTSDRVFIPRSMLYDFFKDRLEGVLRNITVTSEHFNGQPKVFLCSPPPLENLDGVIKIPLVFEEKLKRGVVPSRIRLEFYKIQCEIVSKHCLSLGVAFRQPPSEAVDENGYLKTDYSKKDPTHANELYGKAVLEDLKEAKLLNL